MQRYILTQEQQQQRNAGAGQGAQETRADPAEDTKSELAEDVGTDLSVGGECAVTNAGHGGSVAQVLCV